MRKRPRPLERIRERFDGVDGGVRMLEPSPKVAPVVATACVAVALAGCSIEVNVSTHDHDEPGPPAVVAAPESPEARPAPGQPTPPPVPAPPPPVLAPDARGLGGDSEWYEPAEGPVRDALYRYRRQSDPPPPPPPVEDIMAAPTFTPFTTAPKIRNRPEVLEALAREYPAELRSAGVEGTARVYFLIADDGAVLRRVLDHGSGHAELDDAALRVAEVYRFRPAENRGEPVAVWVSLPISFRHR